MGKKAKTNRGKERAQQKKLDKSTLPPPVGPVDNETGSSKLLEEPKLPGSGYKALDGDGYDDGGVADLTLVIDLEDTVLRRKRGEEAYFKALKQDLLPRVQTGQLAALSRRDQKIKLARILFSEGDEEDGDDDNGGTSEVWQDNIHDNDDEETKRQRQERLQAAKYALRLSTLLREPACSSLSLAEISKRYLCAHGKEGAEDALRCADKALEIASDKFYDGDLISIEGEEIVKHDPKYEENATYPGLSHPTTLKLQSIRVSKLCQRAAYMHRGNALAALGRDDDARKAYETALPLVEAEPRCGRIDWERNSILVNIGNTYSRQGNYKRANEFYDSGEQLGKEHLEADNGNKIEGKGIMIVAMRARAFALRKDGQEDEAKKRLREVLELQMDLDAKIKEKKEKKKKEAEEAAKKAAEEATAAAAKTDKTDAAQVPALKAES